MKINIFDEIMNFNMARLGTAFLACKKPVTGIVHFKKCSIIKYLYVNSDPQLQCFDSMMRINVQ